MSVVARTREVRLARWAQAIGVKPGQLTKRLTAMAPAETLAHDDVSVCRCPSGWSVQLGSDGGSVASTPERALHYLNKRLRLGEHALAARIDELLRDPVQGEDSPTYAEPRNGKILVQFSALRGGFQTLSPDEARRYLDWLSAGNRGGPYEMDADGRDPHGAVRPAPQARFPE